MDDSLTRIKRQLIILLVATLVSACGDDGDGGGGGPCGYAALDTSTQRSSFSGQLSAGGSGAFTIVSLPTKGTVTITNPGTGDFIYTSNTNARGIDTFSFRRGSSNPTTFQIVFTPRVMPLGDSITWGVTSDTTGGDTHNPPIGQRVGYRKALKDRLSGTGYRIDFVGTLQSGGDAGFLANDAEHEGHGGWTTLQLINGNSGASPGTGSGNLAQWLNNAQPDVILLHIGTNDLNGGRAPASVAQDVDALIDVVNSWEASHWPVAVVLARIINENPADSTTTAFNNALISNVYQPRKSGGDQVYWVDQQGALGSGDYADQLHPNASGYQKMGETWAYPLSGGSGRVSGSGGRILAKCS